MKYIFSHGKHYDGSVPMKEFIKWIRFFLVVIVIAFSLLGYVVIKVLQNQDETSLQNVRNHQSRIDEDANLQKQISDLVCTFVDPIPPHTSDSVDKARAKYGCPYIPAPSRSATPRASVTVTRTESAVRTITPTSTAPIKTRQSEAPTPTSVAPTIAPSTRITVPTLVCLPQLGVCL